MNSQFRKLNRPSILDSIWNISSRIRYRKNKSIYFEFGSQLYRFHQQIKLGKDVYLKRNSIIGCSNELSKIYIGNNTTIGFNSIIMASENIRIGNDCMIAPNVFMVDSNHGTEPGIPFNSQLNLCKSILIGNNVWIGAGAIILPGVEIPDDTIIGAGSVVTKTIIKPGVYLGNPARRYSK